MERLVQEETEIVRVDARSMKAGSMSFHKHLRGISVPARAVAEAGHIDLL